MNVTNCYVPRGIKIWPVILERSHKLSGYAYTMASFQYKNGYFSQWYSLGRSPDDQQDEYCHAFIVEKKFYIDSLPNLCCRVDVDDIKCHSVDRSTVWWCDNIRYLVIRLHKTDETSLDEVGTQYYGFIMEYLDICHEVVF